MDYFDKTLIVTPRQNFRTVVQNGNNVHLDYGPDFVDHLNIRSLSRFLKNPLWEQNVMELNKAGFDLTYETPVPFLNICVDLNIPEDKWDSLINNIPVVITKPYQNVYLGYYVTPLLNPFHIEYNGEKFIVKCVEFGTINSEKNVFPGQNN